MYRQSSSRLILVAAITVALLAMTLPLGFACEREGEEAPKADFTAEPTSGTAPLQVQFTDRSSGEIADWAWDFDNDGVPDSTERSPSYSYETPGRYTVSLVVTGPGGSDREIKAQYIEVAGAGPAPEAGFSAEPTSGAVPLDVQFTDESTGDIASWFWNFGDEGTSTEQNPSHTYQSAGTYTVSLTVTDAVGSDTETKADYIVVYAAPVADFSAGDTSVAAAQEVEFTDESTGATGWEWDFDDDGEVDSTEQNPFYAYDAPGQYTVTLTVTGPGGTDAKTKVQYIEVTGTVTIRIGEITDLTGPGSPAIIPLHYALEDIVNYYNEEGLIPGVKFDVVSWDNKYDPSREVPGYDWLREKGAELIVSVIPQTGVTLKPFADKDKFPIVSLSTHTGMLEPPGWVFSMSNPLYSQTKTLLKWISEEHWDYEVEARLPKIGLVGWSEPAIVEIMTAMEEFSQDHPDQFDYTGSCAAPFGTMTWGGEVEALKECDYICAFGFPMGAFMRDFQARGYSTTFIDVGSASAYRGFLVDQCGYEALDGTLSANTSLWWDEGTPMVDLAEELLDRYRPGQAEEIIYAGSGYVGGLQDLVAAFQVLEQAVEEVGATNFDGQAFYDAAVEYETTGPLWEGYPQWGFSQTKRYLVDHVVIYEFSAEVEDLVRISDWLPVIDGVPPEGYTLTMAVNGDGTTDPAVGTHTYSEGSVVTITATPASGWEFDYWSGAASGTSATTSVTMTSNKTVTANFEEETPVTYTLDMAVVPAGAGTTSPAVGTHTYDTGTVVPVTATPAAGYEFVSWSYNVVDGEVTMDADETVTATFAQIMHTLTMAVTGSGTTDPAEGDHDYAEGAVVNITATAASCWEFVNWSGDVAAPTSASTTVTLDAAKTVTANFSALGNLSLTMAVDDPSHGTTSPAVGEHSYACGTLVNITATPATGWEFVNWTGDDVADVADATAASTTVTVDADKSLVANFTNVTHTLTMAVDDPAHGSTTPAVGDHTYGEGRVVTITATPEAGWAFDSWTGDVADANSAITTVTMLSNVTVIANFVEAVGPAVPGVGSEWVYEVSYGAETTEWTVTVTGEETVNGVDCYKTETAYDPAPDRTTGGTAVTITASVNYMSKATFDPVDWGGTPPSETVYSKIAAIDLFAVVAVTTYMTNTYTGDHGWDLSVNTAWTYEQLGTLVPPLAADFSKTYEVEVVGLEDVTVPAGTFSCYKIEHTLIAVDGVPVTPELSKIEYWCPDVSGPVKVIDYTQSTVGHLDWDEVETQELSSYTLV